MERGSATPWMYMSSGSDFHSSGKDEKLLHFLESKITMRGGPISISEFMQDALTSPHGGYYMDKDVFGRSGDFVTSPEISQMFGEMVGAWVVYTWMQLRQPPRLHLVELGPGRGTLMADILRSTAKFKAFTGAVDVHLVEVSPALKALQWHKLGCRPTGSEGSSSSSGGGGGSKVDDRQGLQGSVGASTQMPPTSRAPEAQQGCAEDAAERPEAGEWPPSGNSSSSSSSSSSKNSGGSGGRGGSGGGSSSSGSGSGSSTPSLGLSRFGDIQVTWHVGLSSVPQDQPAIYIAHEFFDALPVHQFVKDPRRGWLEKMVDTADPAPPLQAQSRTLQEHQNDQQQQQQQQQALQGQGHTAPALRLVLSPGSTPASTLLVPIRLKGMEPAQAQKCVELEVSGIGMATAEALAVRVGRHRGAALVVDYGRDAPYGDSLMAIRDHQGVEVLDRPGTSDLSTWVDFGALRQGARESGAPVCVYGPVSQAAFLTQLGIQARLEKLLQTASPAQAEQLVLGYKRLVGDSQGTAGMDQGDGSSSSCVSYTDLERGSSKGSVGTGQDGGMGRSYQVMAICSSDLEGPVAGFEGGTVVNVTASDKVLTNIRSL